MEAGVLDLSSPIHTDSPNPLTLSEGIIGIGLIESADTSSLTPTNPTMPDLTKKGHRESVPVHMEQLLLPTLATGKQVTGASTNKLRKANKRVRRQLQQDQPSDITLWTTHRGDYVLPTKFDPVTNHCNNMCPANLALHHPAAALLTEYATLGCPMETGANWTRQQLQAAIDRGPHASALLPEAIEQDKLEWFYGRTSNMTTLQN
jgi:hypothetical protein